jgi:uncharacterized protein (TIGR02118 family)
MIYKAVSTWSAPKPEDQEEFEEYYARTHVPFAARVPGVLKLALTRTSDGMESPTAFYRVAEMWFNTKEDFEKATKTLEWSDMRKDAGYVHARFGVSLSTGLGYMDDAALDPGGPRPVSGADE